MLLSYDWPGNIRELQNVVEYLVNVSPDQIPLPIMLPKELQTTGPNCVLPDQKEITLLILKTIATFNQQKATIGRRTLASSLGLPESVVRKTLTHLQQEGLIHVSKGRKGLLAH